MHQVFGSKNLFLAAKTIFAIFASPVFTAEKNVFSTFRQKPANPAFIVLLYLLTLLLLLLLSIIIMRIVSTLSHTSIVGGPLPSASVSLVSVDLLVMFASCCFSSVTDRQNISAHSTTDQTLWSRISDSLSPSAFPAYKHTDNLQLGMPLSFNLLNV